MKKSIIFLLFLFTILSFSIVSADNLYYINSIDLPVVVKSLEYHESSQTYAYSNATSYTCIMNVSTLNDISCNTVQQLAMTDHSRGVGTFYHVRPTNDLLFTASLSGATTGSSPTGVLSEPYIVFEENATVYLANTTHFKSTVGLAVEFPVEMQNNVEKCDWYVDTITCLGGGDLRSVYQTDLNGTLLNYYRLESSGTLKDNPIDLTATGGVLTIVTAEKLYLYAITTLTVGDDVAVDGDLLAGNLSVIQKILIALALAIIIPLIFIGIGVVEDIVPLMAFIGVALSVGWLITASVIGWLPAWIVIIMFILASAVVGIVIRKALSGQ